MSTITVHPEGWKPAKGYANGVIAEGRLLFVGGQVGWNAQQEFEAHDFIGQMSQTLHNIRDVVEAAGGSIADITRLTWYATDKDEYLSNQAEVGKAYREVMGYHFPAMTMVIVSALIEEGAKIEIEATAVLPATQA